MKICSGTYYTETCSCSVYVERVSWKRSVQYNLPKLDTVYRVYIFYRLYTFHFVKVHSDVHALFYGDNIYIQQSASTNNAYKNDL